MAQDNTPSVVIYKGEQPKDGYSIPFDKGYYGEIKVAFVRYGLTDYDYDTEGKYEILGELYAWETENRNFVYTYDKNPTPNKTVVYKHANEPLTLDDGTKVTVVSTKGSSATFSNGVTAYYSPRNNIAGHTSLLWTGAPLGEDDYICIVRETQKDQPFVYPNNQKHIEGALDNLSRQIQELKANADASLKVDPSFEIDPRKMSPIAWLNTIVRSTDKTARGLRYVDNWLEYSTDDPNKAEADKSWTKLLNTTNITTIREWYDEEKNIYVPQYSMDGGQTWKLLGAAQLIADVQKQLDDFKDTVYTKTQIDGKLSAVDSQIDANADAIQKTREDYIQADSEIHQILNNHASELTTLRGNQASLGDQVSGIEEKIPGDASATNQLATKADLKGVGGDFVKKSGDTMTGILTIQAEEDYDPSTPPVGGLSFKSNASPDGFTNRMRQVGNGFVAIEYLLNGKQYSNLVFGDQQIYIDNTENGTGNPVSLGTSGNPWDNVYAKKLNNGADISVPTLGGTLARVEDLIDLRADINEADSELQTQITAQAAEIATKQDQLTAGDNIIISNNVISATGAGGGAGFDIVVVQELPATGQKGIIYLLAKDGTTPDVYDEYVWITATQTFELIGSTKVDLTGYVKDTDYASIDKAGIVRLSPVLGTGTNVSGFMQALIKSLAEYKTAVDYLFVGKGTLENIKEDLVARAIESAVNTQNLTVGSGEGTLYIGDVAGTATIATNNGLDIVAQTKFDTAPTTDDRTTYANALDVSLMRKAQVATAVADAVANIDALPDQSGNAGKVLTTDGSTASWQEPQGGGTKVIIKRYE